jgi:hypothetical protein
MINLEEIICHYELVRPLNPREFKQLFARNIKHGEGFDGMIDNMIKARVV